MRPYQLLIKRMKENFTDWDYGLQRVYGVLLGTILGAYFPEFIKKYSFFIVITFILLAIRFFHITFVKPKKEHQEGVN